MKMLPPYTQRKKKENRTFVNHFTEKNHSDIGLNALKSRPTRETRPSNLKSGGRGRRIPDAAQETYEAGFENEKENVLRQRSKRWEEREEKGRGVGHNKGIDPVTGLFHTKPG